MVSLERAHASQSQMNIEQRFSADMDRYFRKKERDRYLCCRLAMSSEQLGVGMTRWAGVVTFTCPACGTNWNRTADGQWGS